MKVNVNSAETIIWLLIRLGPVSRTRGGDGGAVGAGGGQDWGGGTCRTAEYRVPQGVLSEPSLISTDV